MSLRYRVGGVDASGSNYDTQRSQSENTSQTNSRTLSGTSHVLDINVNGGHFCVLEIMRPFLSVPTGLFFSETRGADVEKTGAVHFVSTSYDGFTLFASTGNFASGSKISIYGYSL